MKKTLIALAVLAVSGAAMAQSSVTLYGKIDIELASKKTTDATGATVDKGAKLDSQGLSGNRWGLKGTEDLGGGLKTVFQLEQGFNIDDGSASAAALQFRRQAYVGFNGNFGTVTFGRQYTPVDNLLGSIDPQGNVVSSVYAGVLGYNLTGGELSGGRVDNSIFYQSPTFNGFNAQAMYGLGENKTATTSSTYYAGIGLSYAAVPFGVQFAADQLTAAAGGSTKTWWLGAQYDLSVAKLFVALNGGTTVTDDTDKTYALGATFPITAALSGQVAYAHGTTKMNGATNEGTNKGFGAILDYSLSKRTDVYAEFRNLTTTAAGATADATDKRFGIGLRHAF